MMAHTVETVSVEKVVACIRQYSSRDPEVETPYDTEDAVNTWINKVGTRCLFFLIIDIKYDTFDPPFPLLVISTCFWHQTM